MKNKVTVLVVLAIAASVTIGIIMYYNKSEKAPSQKIVKIGAILPLTGGLAEMGQTERQGMALSLRNINKKSDTKYQLLVEDGKGDAKTVVSAATKLLTLNRVQFLITSTSGASGAASPIAQSYGTPLLAFCMDAELAKQSPTAVRYYIGLEEETKAITKYLLSLPKSNRVAILHGSVSAWVDAASNMYKPALNAHFETPILVEEYNLKSKDFRNQLTKIKTFNANVLVVLGYGFEYKPMFIQMQELGIRKHTNIIGGWGFLYCSLPPEFTEGIRVAGPLYVFDRGEQGRIFDKEFKKAYGKPANFDAAFAYELISKIPKMDTIIKQHGIEQLKPQLVKQGTIHGIIGPYSFDKDGNMKVETAVGIFHNGIIVGN